ncbi:i-type lysozyme [Danaus plexippus plexippus]|uniref:lysozyme n=1 Tax=Danaus plexippus plexippus TaxID=278856 RepID=A0A212F6D5_DANPL|nr:uncharacterized protein LOC116771398 [Danaus plexippus plexippus]OWR49284.1 i-type lysozyme [Danaus plexippus plexippus]
MLLILFLSAFLVFEEVAALHVSNLNETCLRCLCHVAGCDLGHSCTDGYCGPFYISRVYWVDAGKPTLPEDSPERKEGKDCNEDGVTDCFDYMMINHHGSTCSEPLHLTPLGRRRLRLFQQCRLTN